MNQGDTVLTWLPNGPDALRVWFAINYLGAIYVPLNLAYRGKLLEHAVRSSGARLIVAHPDLLPRLDAIDTAQLEQRVALDGADAAAPRWRASRRPRRARSCRGTRSR